MVHYSADKIQEWKGRLKNKDETKARKVKVEERSGCETGWVSLWAVEK